jgi:predicted lipoprotein with Yx(FWY)xxD motif
MRLGIVLMLGLLLAACAQPAAPPPPPPPPPAAVPPPPAALPAPPAEVNRTALGPVLATPQGMTLYTFTRDAPGVSNCNGRCAALWPPFRAPPGAQGFAPWSVVRRADGTMQWAYQGQPLYTYSKDRGPGETSGEGVGGVWHVARPQMAGPGGPPAARGGYY